ncbi:SLC13 family permease [Paraburkholderia rhizosphaerae]|uniref:Anion transporter n=1 Tax=Paraburkholderia rhizosphaerae TaxID=480658 RepID=A0A4R8LQG5_9BURK|nr:SLC13 family permease [Paraburkholderia rhizosphaerae]TDY49780.1 anion transporter [Paraburkholderia rhizosphaerae]
MSDAPKAVLATRRGSAEQIGTAALLLLLVAALAASRHVSPVPGFTPATFRAAILVVFTVVSWALGLFKEPLTTLLFFLFGVLFAVAPPDTLFSGFTSPAWWLVFGGSITGVAVRTTGLAQRLSDKLLSMRADTYRHYIAMVVIASVGLAFVMPSTTGRILILTPIALVLADRLGLSAGRRGRTGVVMAVAAGSYMPSTSVLPANVPNSVLLGAAEQLYGVKLHYAPYLLLHFPLLGAVKTVLIILLICWLYPDKIDKTTRAERHAEPLSTSEKMLVAVLALSLLFYATDFWHGVSPAWVSLAAGVACLLPQARIMSIKDFNEELQIAPLIYVAGFLGLGAVITQSGLGQWAAHWLLDATQMQPGRPILNVALIVAIGIAISMLTTLPALPAVLTPLAGQLAHASGLSLYTVLMLQVPAFSTVILPYQSPPMMIAMHMGNVSIKDGTRLCLTLAVITIVVVLPLDLLWWRVLGALP